MIVGNRFGVYRDWSEYYKIQKLEEQEFKKNQELIKKLLKERLEE